MHISKVNPGKQYVGSKCICKSACQGPACEWRMLSCSIPSSRREITEPTKITGRRWALSLLGQAAKREKGDYRQLRPQPVAANSRVQSPKHPNSPCIWIPQVWELRGAGWTKHFSWNYQLIQTPLCSPACGSSFHLTHPFGPGWTQKKLFPYLYTSGESLLPAFCF